MVASDAAEVSAVAMPGDVRDSAPIVLGIPSIPSKLVGVESRASEDEDRSEESPIGAGEGQNDFEEQVLEEDVSEWPAPSQPVEAHPDDWALSSPPALVEPARTDTSDTSRSVLASASMLASQASGVQQVRPEVITEPFKAPDLAPVPVVPSAGLLPALKYTLAFARARWQRRGAISQLKEQIRKDTSVFDGILGALGRQAHSMGVENAVFKSENEAIDSALERRRLAEHGCSALSNQQAEENSQHATVEAERLARVGAANTALSQGQAEQGALETQRRDLRDQRKSIESRQKGYLKAADSRNVDAETQETQEKREELHAAADTLRRDASLLDQESRDIERRSDALEQPTAELASRVAALKSERDAAKAALSDLRASHRQRLAEIDAEQGRKTRELAQAEAEIERRFVTLGTLVNLNRIEGEAFIHLYGEVDTVRGAIGARSNQIDKLSAEKQAFDKKSLVRGACVLGGGVFLSIAFLMLIFWIF